MVQSFGLSDPGLVRGSNQDRILIDDALGLYLLADGVGGHSHGDDAAELAISSGLDAIRSHRNGDTAWPFGYDHGRSAVANRLMTAVQAANRKLCDLKAASAEYSAAGTTLVAVLVEGAQAAICNVGDSRVYLLRGGDLKQLTVDDTWVGQLVRGGAITEAQARTHSLRNIVTQAVGADAIEVHTCEEQLEDGDLLLLTSDGVHGVLDDSQIRSILTEGPGVEDGARRLIAAALERGGPDNTSCILFRYRRGGNQEE
jgi:protein phosphatase